MVQGQTAAPSSTAAVHGGDPGGLTSPRRRANLAEKATPTKLSAREPAAADEEGGEGMTVAHPTG